MALTEQSTEQAQRCLLNLELPTNFTSPTKCSWQLLRLLESERVAANANSYNRSKFPERSPKSRLRTANDAFSSKIAWPKLASITAHAGPRCFWRRGDLQCDVHAQRPVCRRLLAETSKLGRRRCLRVHGDQFGSLPVDSLGRPADVSGRHCVSNPDKVYGGQSLWSAQLAASGTNQFSARAACGCSRDYGVGAVPDPVSPDASRTAITALGSDCGGAMSFDPHATRLGRSHYLGPCDVCIVVRRRPAIAVLGLHHSHRNRLHPDCH